MQRRLAHAALIGSVLPLLACGRSAHAPAMTSLIDGFWQGACLPLSDSIFPSRQISYLFASDRSAERREEYAASADCSAPRSTVTFRGRYELEVARESYLYRIDLYYDEVKAEASSPEGSLDLAAARVCGIESWPVGEERDVALLSGKGCPGLGVLPIKNLNLVEIKRAKALNFGTDMGHDNPRPAAVDGESPLFRFKAVSPR